MEEEKEEIPVVSPEKLRKLRNLKYFRDWTDDQIIEWAKQRKKNEPPPPSPTSITSEIPVVDKETVSMDAEEYDKKYKKYLAQYRKELGVDMNNTNDAESLRSLVRYVIQHEQVNIGIFNEQKKPVPNTKVLKDLGDFQRTVQQNINEIQDRLGISRKQRKEKQVDSVPLYIKGIQDKAKKFWERSTLPVRCERCHIELARYWLNFPDMVQKVHFELRCDNCKEIVIYSA